MLHAFNLSALHKRARILLTGGMLALLFGCSGESADSAGQSSSQAPAPAPAEPTAVEQAMEALGMEGMDTLSYTGTAWRVRNSFRQTLTASPPWPDRDTITNYQRTINLSGPPASRASGDTFASNIFLAPPVAGTYTQDIRPEQTAWSQLLEIALTPWGFLKGAERYGATEEAGELDGTNVTVVTWQTPETIVSPSGMRYTVVGYIDGDNLVRKVETWVEDAFMGDMNVVALYDSYRQIDGNWVPATMEQLRGGGGVFGLALEDMTVNPPNAAELLTFAEQTGGGPPGGFGASIPEDPMEAVREVAEGVHLIEGPYVAMVVEFSDHVAVFEAGGSAANGQLIVDAVAALHPDKEFRYLINSHPHSDHTAGMIPVVRAGPTIVTHESNVEFMDMALNSPRTLLGEEPLNAEFYPGVGEVTVLEDDTRRLELHQIKNLHSVGTIVAYLPNEGILFQADFTLPQPGAQANPFVIDLANYVDQNGLEFEQYLAVHAAQQPQTMDDLLATIGK